MVLGKFKQLFRSRSSTKTQVSSVTDCTDERMRNEIAELVAKNQEGMKDIVEEGPVTAAWLRDARDCLGKHALPFARSLSMLELRSCNYDESEGVTKEVQKGLLKNLKKWGHDFGLTPFAEKAAMEPYPNRIISIGNSVFLIYSKLLTSDKLRIISNYIESFVMYGPQFYTGGSPLYPSNDVNTPYALLEETPSQGIVFKRVTFLGTLEVYDIFFEFDTGKIRQCRFDKTRVFKMPGYLNFFNIKFIKTDMETVKGSIERSKSTDRGEGQEQSAVNDEVLVIRLDPKRKSLRRCKSWGEPEFSDFIEPTNGSHSK